MKPTDSATTLDAEVPPLTLEQTAQSATGDLAFRYLPRWVEAQELIAVNGYRLKPYSMHLSDRKEKRTIPPAELRNLLKTCLPTSVEQLDHGVGFLMVHYARDGNYLLISRWYGGNMLKHELFRLTQTADDWQAEPLRSTNIVACVWELQIITFERQAWVCTAMAKAGTEASFNSYLQMVFEGWV
jgi:hypothetical protein